MANNATQKTATAPTRRRVSRKRKTTNSAPAVPKRWLSRAEVADYTGYSESTIKRAVSNGELPAYKATKARACPLKFDVHEVDAWIRGTSEPGDA